jgi:hypothetical protein
MQISKEHLKLIILSESTGNTELIIKINIAAVGSTK